MKLSKKTKAALESFLWMLILATGPLILEQIESGKAIWELDLKAFSSGLVLVFVRFTMNYQNKSDTRYGPDKGDNKNNNNL